MTIDETTDKRAKYFLKCARQFDYPLSAAGTLDHFEKLIIEELAKRNLPADHGGRPLHPIGISDGVSDGVLELSVALDKVRMARWALDSENIGLLLWSFEAALLIFQNVGLKTPREIPIRAWLREIAAKPRKPRTTWIHEAISECDEEYGGTAPARNILKKLEDEGQVERHGDSVFFHDGGQAIGIKGFYSAIRRAREKSFSDR